MEKEVLKKVTFYELAQEWLQYKKNNIKEPSYLNYKFIIESKFKRELGEKNIEELLEYNFNYYIENLMSELCRKSVKDIVAVLKSILKYAELKYEINFKLSLISSPSIYKKEVEVLDDKERKILEKYCIKQKEDLKTLGIIISLYTGLRIGEVCALKWKDINFEHRYINVTSTIQRVYIGKRDTKVIRDTPKTLKSIRKIPLSKVLYETLKPMAKNFSQEDFVLTGEKEKWVEPLGYRYTYRQILKECQIKYKKFHALRHTFATRCVKVGMDVKSLSEVLGHANPTVTLNVYIHSSFETKNKFINRL